MNNNIPIEETILLGYFADTISPGERAKVEEWLSASDENRKMARDIYYICFSTDTVNTIKSLDIQSALKHVNTKIERRHRISFITWMQRVAAVLFIPLLLSTVYYMVQKDRVEYIEVRTNPGMVGMVNLPDGSKVWLNSSSYLRHPSKFAGDTREVEIEGEAYFSVQKDHGRKFIVQAPNNLKVEVLGTEFNMEAYKQNQFVTTTLVSGSVKLEYRTAGQQLKTIVMKPDDKMVYNASSGTMECRKAFVAGDIAWKDMKIVLRNTSLDETLNLLSKRFNVDFVLKNESIRDNSFTGTFDSQQLQKILEYFRISSGINYRIIDSGLGAGGIKERITVELY